MKQEKEIGDLDLPLGDTLDRPRAEHFPGKISMALETLHFVQTLESKCLRKLVGTCSSFFSLLLGIS